MSQSLWALVRSAILGGVLGFAIVVSAKPANAQGPAGNRHPDVDVRPGAVSNPLQGTNPAEVGIVETRAKYEFSTRVDLSPLTSLPIMASGRVGIFDTLARNTIRRITNKSRYRDFLHKSTAGGNKDEIEKVSYDPIFTLIDMMADPLYYLDKPVIHVQLLPLRRAMLEQAFPGDRETQERWLKLTRIQPRVIFDMREKLNTYGARDPAFSRGVGEVFSAQNRLFGAYTQMDMIAPASEGERWKHISEDPEVAALFRSMGEAWRALDHDRVNALAVDISDALLRAESPVRPPMWRRQLELMYNGRYKMAVGYTIYFLALVALLIAFGTGRSGIRLIGTGSLLIALAIHLLMFVTRWILAERVPIQNQFESMMGLCLGAVLFGTITMFARRQLIFGAAASAVGFLTLMVATTRGIPGREIQPEAAILNTSYILFYHVNIVLFSYGLIAMGAMVSAVYLLTHYLRSGDIGAQFAAAGLAAPENLDRQVEGSRWDFGTAARPGRARLLSDLDHAQMVILQLAFWILGVGILLGAWWADHSWGRFWAFDPKETWALITWIIYLIVIHVRMGARNRGLTTAWLSIIGFLIMLWTYFGVNLLLPGLHAYA